MVRSAATGELLPATWAQALSAVAAKAQTVQGNEIKAIAGDLADAEAMLALKDLVSCLGSDDMAFADGISLPADFRSSYLFNATIAGIDQADLIILVGTNPRMEAAVLNTRIRKANFSNDVPVYGIGSPADLALGCDWVGNDYAEVEKLISKQGPLAAKLAAAKKPIVVVGVGAFQGANAAALPGALSRLQVAYPNLTNADYNGLSVLQSSAARVAAQDIGFVAGPVAGAAAAAAAAAGKAVAPKKLLFLLGADSEYVKTQVGADTFVVYQGHNGDIGAELADVVLPAAAFTEKTATYVNTEGRVQSTFKATDLKGQAKEDWAVVRALAEVMGVPLPYVDREGIQARMHVVAPHLAEVGTIQKPSLAAPAPTAAAAGAAAAKLKAGPLPELFADHYMTNAVARASETMAKTSAQLPVSRNSYLSLGDVTVKAAAAAQ